MPAKNVQAELPQPSANQPAPQKIRYRYLNIAETPLFHKSAQLFGGQNLIAGQIPIIVDGPIDAIAVTLAGAAISGWRRSAPRSPTNKPPNSPADPLAGADADIPGQVAAERAFWPLAPTASTPAMQNGPTAATPPTSSPATDSSRWSLRSTGPSPSATLWSERLRHLPAGQARIEAIQIIAARPPVQ
jgi:hypothetical protein